MSTVEEFQRRLVAGELLSSQDAEALAAAWREETSGLVEVPAEDFIDWLIEQGKITEFQGDAIVEGHSGPFMLGPYRVYEQIAPATVGSLYRAVHDEFNQPVTLKIFPRSLKDDPEMVARIGREARIFAELDHPNVLRSFQVGRVGDTFYLAFEDLKGETLAARLERDERLHFEEACRIIRDTARGLEHLHQNDVVHRDLRPGTIWITDEGVPKVIEFGAARDAYAWYDEIEAGRQVAPADRVVGHYEYMATEQAEDVRNADARSDIYALGCVLYHCLAGHPPFVDRDPVKLVLKHVRQLPPRVSDLLNDVPHPVDDTLAGMLAKEPDDRFQTAEQVAFALDQYVPAEEMERVAVVDVSDEYLEWVQAHHPTEPHHVADDAEGISPELAEFLGWMSRRRVGRGERALA